MAGRGKNFLIGCGLSCLAVVVLGIALVVGLTVWVRGKMKGVDESIALGQTLEQRFGRSEDFVPWTDGAIPAERMEAFLRVREVTAPPRQAIVAFFSLLPKDPAAVERLESASILEKLRFALELGRAGVGTAEHLAEFLRARNVALDQAGLGFGEYTYIYVTAYYGWLGHPPGDDGESHGSAAGAEKPDAWETARVRDEYVAQLTSLRQGLDPSADPAVAAWAEQLSAEIEALREDPRRAPWREGLPEAIRAALEPYRERLEATYSPAANPFELSHSEKNHLSIRID